MNRQKPICNAPFANLYIDAKGNVTPCCFNREDILGNIYTDSIDAIWHSSVAQRLRNQMYHHSLPSGCKACKIALEAKNYFNSGIFTYARLDYKMQQIQAIDFELSYYCNLSCVMCNLHTKSYDLTVQQELVLLEKITPVLKTIKKARFYGGEPLIIPIYRKIWYFIVKENPSCTIMLQTNGMIVDDELKSLAKKGNFSFAVSLDSIDEQNAAYIRRGSQIKLVLKNIEELKKIATQDVSLAITPMRLNWKEIPSLISYANKHSMHVFFNTLVQPRNLAFWSLQATEIKEIIDYYQNFHILPFSIKAYYNKIKFKGLLNYLTKLYREALLRPNYSKEELQQWAEKIYEAGLSKLPNLSMLNKDTIIEIIKVLLQTRKAEDLLLIVHKESAEKLEEKVQNMLHAE